MARADVLSVFAEPGILHPKIVTFHLDRDVSGIVGPFRFVTRPISVFDIVGQGWRNEEARYGPGMMFLFGTPAENARWLVTPGLRFTANSLFRPWNNPDEWIRQSMSDTAARLTVGFEDFRNISDEFEHPTEMQEYWRHANNRLTQAGEQRDNSKEWMVQWKNAFEKDTSGPPYSTATSTTAHMTRNADGSVHKETITTERLFDGSTKTTRIVDTTPADGNSRSETTITTTPPRHPPSTSLPDSFPSSHEVQPGNRHYAIKSSEEPEKVVEADKNENNNLKNSAWWFWSRSK